MKPRNFYPDDTYLLQIRCAGAIPGLCDLHPCAGLLGFHLAWSRQRHPSVQIHAAVQRPDGYDLVVTDRADALSDFQARANRLVSQRRNAALNRTGHAFFSSACFKAIRLRTKEDIWDALVDLSVYPTAANIVRKPENYDGLHLTPSNLGSHHFPDPDEGNFHYDFSELPPPHAPLNLTIPPAFDLTPQQYKSAFRRRRRARLADLHARNVDYVGNKAIQQLSAHKAPIPTFPADSPSSHPGSPWKNHLEHSANAAAQAKANDERRQFLKDYAECRAEVSAEGWPAFDYLEWPPGTYGPRRFLKATVRGSPAPGVPAPRSAI